MNRGIYATATGMIASQQLMDVIAQNLANANTTGYKRDAIAFDDALVRELRADGGRGPVIGSIGMGSVEKGRFTVFDEGSITETGNALDLAIRGGEGAFAIQTDRGVRYTRDGAFTRSSEGVMVTKQGNPVLDNQGKSIDLPEGKEVEIGNDGSVLVEGVEIAQLGIFKGQFTKEGNNLFSATGATLMENPEIQPKAIEGSNVNTIEAMVAMINVSRSYEMAQRSITSQDELTQKLIQSLPNQ